MEGFTGVRTPIFRAPYTADIDPDLPDDLAVLRIALANGYLFVGANVDPDDWDGKSPHAIVKTVVGEVSAGKGSIVVMHDGGGDRARASSAGKKLVAEVRRRRCGLVSRSRR